MIEGTKNNITHTSLSLIPLFSKLGNGTRFTINLPGECVNGAWMGVGSGFSLKPGSDVVLKNGFSSQN